MDLGEAGEDPVAARVHRLEAQEHGAHGIVCEPLLSHRIRRGEAQSGAPNEVAHLRARDPQDDAVEEAEPGEAAPDDVQEPVPGAQSRLEHQLAGICSRAPEHDQRHACEGLGGIRVRCGDEKS